MGAKAGVCQAGALLNRKSSTAATSNALSARELKHCADMMVEKPFFICSRAAQHRLARPMLVSEF
jgi:hypothetical protein